MKLFHVKRTSQYEHRYSKKMGILKTRVTYIKKYVLIFPLKTLHKYRETYYGEIKSCSDCSLTA